MARHRSFTSLSRALRRRARTYNLRAGDAIRQASLIADSAVVLATPVDLGRARSSWAASVGSAMQSDTGINEDIGGQAASNIALQQARSVIGRWQLGQGSIFISNSVAYIIPLNEGHSAQAPEGMTDQAILAAQTFLRRVRLLDERR